MTYDEVRGFALALPGVEDGTSYGTPALKVRGKLLCRLKEDGESLVVRVSFDEREILMEVEPETFFITPHYRDWPGMLVRLATVVPETLRRLLLQTWKQSVTKKMLAEFEAARP